MKEIDPYHRWRERAGAGDRRGDRAQPPYYRGHSFEELVLSEPDPYMLDRLRAKFDNAGVRRRVEAPAERLPFSDHYFDTVLSVHVLCSVHDLPKALAEVRRVLKPGANSGSLTTFGLATQSERSLRTWYSPCGVK
jgi:ubiquinone/menaquinone biosynthesis C-methylase UbiE